MSTSPHPRRLGIALGGGAARGWAHIGVLRTLREHGIDPDVICGTSMGALVGAAWATGRLAPLEEWVQGLTRRRVLSLLDFRVGAGGAIRGLRLTSTLEELLGDTLIEEVPTGFAAVATDLDTGAEVWLQNGPLLPAVRASISIPGIFAPVQVDGRWMADGGLVNPVPVSLCRALGADIVIAVDVNASMPTIPRSHLQQPSIDHDIVPPTRPWLARLEGALGFEESVEAAEDGMPTPRFSRVVSAALDIMQERITRGRLTNDPPDLLLTPEVGHVDPLDFTSGEPIVQEGCETVERMLPHLRRLLTNS